MTDAERLWHRELDAEILLQDQQQTERTTKWRLAVAQHAYLQAAHERLAFLDEAAKGWYGD